MSARLWLVGTVAVAACKFTPPSGTPDGRHDGSDAMGQEGPPPGAWLDPWMHRKTITFLASQIEAPNDGALTAFPALVSITDTELAGGALADGSDIVFTQSDATTMLDSEVESYAAGVLVAWVKVPSLSATADTTIYMYYGDANPPAATPEQVWTESYLAVYHLQQDPSPGNPGEMRDATAGNHDGTAESTMDATNTAPGQVGPAIRLDGTKNFIDFTNALDVGAAFTISLWMNMPAVTNIRTLISNSPDRSNTDGFRFFSNSNGTGDRKIHFETGDGGSSGSAVTSGNITTADRWAHVAVIVDRSGGSATIVVDGTVANTGAIKNDFATSSDYEIGRMETNNPYAGMLDELEIASTLRPIEWIRTAFNNQKAPGSFHVLGSEETK